MKRILWLIAVLALVASGCGGAADAQDGVASLDDSVALDTPESTDVPAMTEEEALLAFTACLRDNGIDVADPTVDADGNLRLSRPNNSADGQGAPSEEARAARGACRSLLDGVALGFQDVDRTELEDQLLEFAACMRDNGVDMPDPDFSSATPGPGGGGPFGAIDGDDPDFQAAQEACQDSLPGFGRGFGGGRPPGNG